MNIENFPVFAGLNATQIDNLLSATQEVTLGAGERIISQGTPGTELFFVFEGKVRVHMTSSKQEQELAVITAPCAVGELELLAGGDHTASVTAIDECVMRSISYETLQQRLVDGDVASLKIVHNMSRFLARRMRALDERLIEIVNKSSAPEVKDLQALKAKLFGEWST